MRKIIKSDVTIAKNYLEEEEIEELERIVSMCLDYAEFSRHPHLVASADTTKNPGVSFL